MDNELDTIAAACTPTEGTAFERMRAQIMSIEQVVLGQEQVMCPLRHIFAPGVYVRELTIPADTVLTGAIHLTEHVNVISKGDISVLTEQGMVRIQAPYTFVSKRGTKRVGYTHSETVWSTIHVTDETDITTLEATLATNDFSDPRLPAPSTEKLS